ncbi:thioredoxin domain-containing protein [Candidatus Saccharibacteria bacterium]|nr:thioredoxin domain-containing protein [Candidatus Saccharibacteria bacterium]
MKKEIRIIILASLIGFLVFTFMIGAIVMGSKTSHEDKVWDPATTIGKMDAKNYYIFYTDLACPYCDVWSRLTLENKEDFTNYLEKNHILYEVRVTEFLYENSGARPEMSRWSAKGAFCAAKQNKFWEYYEAGIMSLWKDYHSKGVGSSKDAPMISGMKETYWTENIASQSGVDMGEFKSCYSSEETLSKVKENTEKAYKTVQSGLPYYVFNSWVQSGFDPSWDYNYVKQYLDAGLKK